MQSETTKKIKAIQREFAKKDRSKLRIERKVLIGNNSRGITGKKRRAKKAPKSLPEPGRQPGESGAGSQTPTQ